MVLCPCVTEVIHEEEELELWLLEADELFDQVVVTLLPPRGTVVSDCIRLDGVVVIPQSSLCTKYS